MTNPPRGLGRAAAEGTASVTASGVARLESVAQQLAARVRDEEPWQVHAWLARELPDPKDWYRLCFVLACAIPDDRTWLKLTDWARTPVEKVQRARKLAAVR